MKRFLPLIFITILAVPSGGECVPFSGIWNTDEVAQGALKYGFLATFCATQSCTGLTESYHFTNNHDGHIVNRSNYHVFETVRRAGWMTTGWFMYANIRDADLTWFGKARRILGSAMVARNFYEWSYKANKYGNPFDYTEKHNDKALVYFEYRGGHIVDAYIGTGPISGPLVDMAFLVGGLLLFK